MPKLDDLNTDSNRRLFDLLFRHQVYLEGVKSGFAGNYKAMLNKLYAEFARYLLQNRYATIDLFNKGELNDFIRKFTRAQQRFYSIYTDELVKLLQQFLAIDLDIHKEILQDVTAKTPTEANQVLRPVISEDDYANLPIQFQPDYAADITQVSRTQQITQYRLTKAYQENENASGIYGVGIVAGTDESNTRLWATVTNSPVPANGKYVLPMIEQFGTAANASIDATIRKGYANAWTKQQLADSILGTDDNYSGGLLKLFSDRHTALVATILQHVTSEVQGAVASIYFEQYQWVAIMDNRTTPICIARNGVVYVFGEGPFPPAHWFCRSKIVPVQSGTKLHDIPKTFADWLVTQPDWVLNDMLGTNLISGSISATSFSNIRTVKPLTLTEFQGKVKYILGE